MSTRKSFWTQGRALLILAIMLGSTFYVGLSFGLTLNGTWSGDWLTEQYGNFTSGLKDEALTSGRVVIAGADGLLGDDADLKFVGGTTLETVNVSAADVSAGTLHGTGLTSPRIPIVGAGGLLEDDADLTFTGGDTLNVANISTSGLYVNGEKYYPEMPVSYTVWNDTLIYAKNGLTGAVTNNTDAATLIQSVVISGKVLIKNGEYRIGTMIDINHPIILSGEGYGTLLKNKDGIKLNSVIEITVGNVTVENLRVDGNRASFVADAAYWGQGIDVISTAQSNVIIRNCFIHDTYMGGVTGTGLTEITIKDNVIWNTGKTGAGYGGHGIYFSYTENSVFEGNKVSPDTTTTPAGQAIKITGVIGSAGGGHYGRNDIISGNTITGGGILLYGAEKMDVHDNVIINAINSIHLGSTLTRDVQIHNNLITGDAATSNYLCLFESVQDCVFDENVMVNCGSGITVSGSRIKISNNEFRNCTIAQDIVYSTANDVLISGNYFMNILTSNGRAIYVYSGSGEVSGNYIYQTPPVSGANMGIKINANYIHITNNKLINCVYGIYDGKDYTFISQNNMVNSTYPITASGANSIINNNVGYRTENFLTVTNTTATTFVFNHGLAGDIDAAGTHGGVWMTFDPTTEAAITGRPTWTSSATQVTVTVAGAGLPATMTLRVYMTYKP